MGYRKLSTGQRNFFKFEKEGDKLEGIWRGISSGKYGPVGCIQDRVDGDHYFTINAALQDLELVPVGTQILIEFTGWDESKNGRRFKTFEISIDENVVLEYPKPKSAPATEPKPAPVESAGTSFEATEDDVPF